MTNIVEAIRSLPVVTKTLAAPFINMVLIIGKLRRALFNYCPKGINQRGLMSVHEMHNQPTLLSKEGEFTAFFSKPG